MQSSNYILFCDQLKDSIKKYPNLSIHKDNNDFHFLNGILDIPNDKNEIVGNFLIEIHYSDNFPFGFPLLLETGGEIPNEADWHKYENGSCCITVWPDEILKCKNGISVSFFIKTYAIPYLANQIYRKQTGKYKNGEYAHGQRGISQFYEDLMKTSNRSLWFQYYENTFHNLKVKCGRNDPCPCNSGNKFKFCHLEVFNKLQIIGAERVLNDFKLII